MGTTAVILLLGWLYERGARHHTAQRMTDLARHFRRCGELDGETAARDIEYTLDTIEPAMTASLFAPLIAVAASVARAFGGRQTKGAGRESDGHDPRGPNRGAAVPPSDGVRRRGVLTTPRVMVALFLLIALVAYIANR